MYQNINSCVYKNGTYLRLFFHVNRCSTRRKPACFLNDLEPYLEIAGILSLDMTFTALSDFGNTMYHLRHLKLKI